MKCDKCGNIISNKIQRADGLPNGVGFELEDGRLINLCSGCIMCLGMLNDEGKKKFFNELGVDTKK